MDCCSLRLCNTFRRLWIEHVLWTRSFIVSTAFSLPDLEFVTERLLQNPVDFAKAFKPFYGQQAAMQIEQLFTDHLLIAAQLVNAAKAGNTAQVNTERNRWYENAKDIAKFLASINRFWTEELWTKLLFDHLKMTEDEAVYILTGQYENSIKEYDHIQAEALTMADVMACGIAQQFRIT
ncbi:MAG: acetylglutamate kinase [Clostridiales bacterium]|nr:acetylglutamate kinase [Clostridiales bacterium]